MKSSIASSRSATAKTGTPPQLAGNLPPMPELAPIEQLFDAVECNDVATVRHIVQSGMTSVDQFDHHGLNALMYACMRGQTEIVRTLLLQASANPALAAAKHPLSTALHLAVETDNHEIVALLVDVWPAGVNMPDAMSMTPLHYASRYGFDKTLACLLASTHKVEVDHADALCSTPLHYAVMNRHETAYRLLLEYGANVSAQNLAGQTPHDLASFAVRGQFDRITEEVIQQQASHAEQEKHAAQEREERARAFQITEPMQVPDPAPEPENEASVPPRAVSSIAEAESPARGTVSAPSTVTRRNPPRRTSTGHRNTERRAAMGGQPLGSAAHAPTSEAEAEAFRRGSQMPPLAPLPVAVPRLPEEIQAIVGFTDAQRDEIAQILTQLSNGLDLSAHGLRILFEACAKGYHPVVKWLLDEGLSINSRDAAGHTPLMVAIACQRPALAQYLARQPGIDIMARDHTHWQAIHHALEKGMSLLPEMLLKQYSIYTPIDVPEMTRTSALEMAVRCANESLVLKLLQLGCQPNSVDGQWNTPLHHAVWTRKIALVGALLSDERTIVDKRNIEQATPLDLANKLGQEDVIALLRAKVDAKSRALPASRPVQRSKTISTMASLSASHLPNTASQAHPLIEACLQENESVVRKLLKQGENPRAIFDASGRTPIQIVQEKGNVALASLLRDAMLFFAIKSSDGEGLAKLLIEQGANPNWNKGKGWTALHSACRGTNARIVEILLQGGGNPNLPETEKGNTPLHIASKLGLRSVIDVLLRYGADPNLKNKAGETALIRLKEDTPDHTATASRLQQACQDAPRAQMQAKENLSGLLFARLGGSVAADRSSGLHAKILVTLNQCGDINQAASADPKGWSPLHHACHNGDEKLARLLILHGANVNAQASDGQTPLHLLAATQCRAMIKMMASAGADINAQTAQGVTPLHVAIRSNQLGMLGALVKYGANPNLTLKPDFPNPEDQGATPLHYAIGMKRFDAARVLIRHTETDMNARDARGDTPLHYAARDGQTGIAAALVQHGAMPSLRNHAGKSPADLITGGALTSSLIREVLNSPEQFRDLQDSARRTSVIAEVQKSKELSNRRLSLICCAMFNDDTRLIEQLLHTVDGGIASFQQNDPKTNLIFLQACVDGHLPLVSRLLMENKVSPTCLTLDQLGWQPLHLAAWHGHVDIITVLLQMNAPINATTRTGQITPLQLACRARRLEAMNQLTHDMHKTKHTLNWNARDINGWNALHHATVSGDEAIVIKLLRANKIDLTCKGKIAHGNHCDEYSAFDLAVGMRHNAIAARIMRAMGVAFCTAARQPDQARQLHDWIACQVPVDWQDHKGWTALHHACDSGNVDAVITLLLHGANSQSRTHDGATPHDLARRYPDIRAVLALTREEIQARARLAIEPPPQAEVASAPQAGPTAAPATTGPSAQAVTATATRHTNSASSLDAAGRQSSSHATDRHPAQPQVAAAPNPAAMPPRSTKHMGWVERVQHAKRENQTQPRTSTVAEPPTTARVELRVLQALDAEGLLPRVEDIHGTGMTAWSRAYNILEQWGAEHVDGNFIPWNARHATD